MRTGGRATEASRLAVEDLAFSMGRKGGRVEAMSQLGLRGKSFLNGCKREVSVQGKIKLMGDARFPFGQGKATRLTPNPVTSTMSSSWDLSVEPIS